jgi:4-nitrophenyl phosphatase
MSGPDVLSRYSGFLVDIDGVLVRGDRPLEGAAEALSHLRARGRTLLLTNNSSRSCAVLASDLTELGFRVDPSDVLPSARIAADHLANEVGFVRFWVIGEAGLTEELQKAGHRRADRPADAEWLIAGIDRHISYDTLADALTALMAGARFLGTNNDPTFPGPDGILPGAGAILGAIAGMGYPPEATVGKPSEIAFRAALRLLDLDPSSVLMIGDRLETDVVGAREAEIDTALVLTGIADRAAIGHSRIQPTWIAESLHALVSCDVEPGPVRPPVGPTSESSYHRPAGR